MTDPEITEPAVETETTGAEGTETAEPAVDETAGEQAEPAVDEPTA